MCDDHRIVRVNKLQTSGNCKRDSWLSPVLNKSANYKNMQYLFLYTLLMLTLSRADAFKRYFSCQSFCSWVLIANNTRWTSHPKIVISRNTSGDGRYKYSVCYVINSLHFNLQFVHYSTKHPNILLELLDIAAMFKRNFLTFQPWLYFGRGKLQSLFWQTACACEAKFSAIIVGGDKAVFNVEVHIISSF